MDKKQLTHKIELWYPELGQKFDKKIIISSMYKLGIIQDVLKDSKTRVEIEIDSGVTASIEARFDLEKALINLPSWIFDLEMLSKFLNQKLEKPMISSFGFINGFLIHEALHIIHSEALLKFMKSPISFGRLLERELAKARDVFCHELLLRVHDFTAGITSPQFLEIANALEDIYIETWAAQNLGIGHNLFLDFVYQNVFDVASLPKLLAYWPVSDKSQKLLMTILGFGKRSIIKLDPELDQIIEAVIREDDSYARLKLCFDFYETYFDKFGQQESSPNENTERTNDAKETKNNKQKQEDSSESKSMELSDNERQSEEDLDKERDDNTDGLNNANNAQKKLSKQHPDTDSVGQLNQTNASPNDGDNVGETANNSQQNQLENGIDFEETKKLISQLEEMRSNFEKIANSRRAEDIAEELNREIRKIQKEEKPPLELSLRSDRKEFFSFVKEITLFYDIQQEAKEWVNPLEEEVELVHELKDISQNLSQAINQKHTAGRPKDRGSKIIKNRLSHIVTDGKIFGELSKRTSSRGRPEVVILGDLSGSTAKFVKCSDGKSRNLYKYIIDCVYSTHTSLSNARIPVASIFHSTSACKVKNANEHCNIYQVAVDGLMGYSKLNRLHGRDFLSFGYTHFGYRSDFKRIFIEKSFNFKKSFSILKNNRQILMNNLDHAALSAASEYFTDNTNSKIILVLSDGTPAAFDYQGREEGKIATMLEIDSLRKKGITVISLSVAPEVVESNNEIYGEQFNIDCSNGKLGQKLLEIVHEIASLIR